MKPSKVKPLANKPPKVPQTPNSKKRPRDPVEVYCRMRPLVEGQTCVCAEAVGDTAVRITPPESSLAFKSGHRNATQHTFKYVFKEDAAQKAVFDKVGFPLVEDLIQGKDGLLFAYGITNSGKTHTITGEPDNAGILPICLDVIFNSIADVQATRYVYRPDGSNGFDVFTESEARKEQSKNKGKKIGAKARSEMSDYGDILRISETRKVEGVVDEDSNYAVFVSYIEIYNNYVYDLLEELPFDPIKPKPPQSKILREDQQRNMYVSGVTEVEVKSTEEAFDILYKGQKRRRVAETQLNHESSRSHSVFTIRLVQAPLDPSGEEVIQDKSKVTVSQISLVDLAGSERTSRTNSSGDRLREAGSINAVLMVLRTCMETLRENQLQGTNKIVPYRDSKLTHLFKNHYDGEGKVKMIVCISTSADDYDESIHVMKFAELTQEVVVDRPESVKPDVGLPSGRRRANLIYKQALHEAALKETEVADPTAVPAMLAAVHPFQLAFNVISLQKYLCEVCDVSVLSEFKAALENREKIRAQLIEDLKKKQNTFRAHLCAQEQELCDLKASVQDLSAAKSVKEKASREAQKLKAIVASQEEQLAALRANLESVKAELALKSSELGRMAEDLAEVTKQKDILLRTTEQYELDNRDLQHQVATLHAEHQVQLHEKETIQKTMTGFVSKEREKFEQMSRKMEKDLEEKNGCEGENGQHQKGSEQVQVEQQQQVADGATAAACTTVPAPVKGKGRKRSVSDNWLEHKPTDIVDNGELLQPIMKKKKTVSTPTTKDLNNKQVDKYCLQHQEQDSDGDVKTKLFKGEIKQTVGGGTSVQFTDVEVLHHSRPATLRKPASPIKKMKRSASANQCNSSQSSEGFTDRSTSDEEWTDVETRCAVAIEGRPGSQPAFTHAQLSSQDR
ncbi:hypothetical protein EMCRGX_G030160 [Ephydatia muelleri]